MSVRPPAKGTAKLVFKGLGVKINGTVYAVTDLRVKGQEWPKVAWRLTKENGTEYDIHLDHGVPQCTCPDFMFGKRPGGCKHVAGLRVLGMLKPS